MRIRFESLFSSNRSRIRIVAAVSIRGTHTRMQFLTTVSVLALSLFVYNIRLVSTTDSRTERLRVY